MQAAPNLPPVDDGIARAFNAREVVRIIGGLTLSQLRNLDRQGIVNPTGNLRGRRAYTFGDVVALRAARSLLADGVKMRDLVRAVESIRFAIPSVVSPLAELRLASDSARVVVKAERCSYEAVGGQVLLDFSARATRPEEPRVVPLMPITLKERAKQAYELYTQAAAIDEDEARLVEAEAIYRRAIALDPALIIARTNLGNVRYRRGDEVEAEAIYREAIKLDDKQPEAQYNLGYLMLESGRAAEAIGFFRAAIASDPKFADAHFNLAMAYEQAGKKKEARPCWRQYLMLEPKGEWADAARRHL